MPSGVTYVTEEHFFFVEGALAYSRLGTGYNRRGATVGIGRGWYGCRRG